MISYGYFEGFFLGVESILIHSFFLLLSTASLLTLSMKYTFSQFFDAGDLYRVLSLCTWSPCDSFHIWREGEGTNSVGLACPSHFGHFRPSLHHTLTRNGMILDGSGWEREGRRGKTIVILFLKKKNKNKNENENKNN